MLDSLQPNPGSRPSRIRKGRGNGSRKGKTCGRGQKGYGSRSGSKRRAYFEGGQMPLARRLPKRGFFSPNRVPNQIVNLKDLAGFDANSVVDAAALAAAGLVRRADGPIKLLAEGEISAALNVKVARASRVAVQKIEAAGGSVEVDPPKLKGKAKGRAKPRARAETKAAAEETPES